MAVSPESRSVWPPRLVDVLEDAIWKSAQMVAWRVGPNEHDVQIRFCFEDFRIPERPLVWVKAFRVRPRSATAQRDHLKQRA